MRGRGAGAQRVREVRTRRDVGGLRAEGILADVTPTLLELMGQDQPEEMTGESLIEHAARI